MYQNLWRETLLLNFFDSPNIAKVTEFGQLPNQVIFREIKEVKGITLSDYIQNHVNTNRIDLKKFDSKYTNDNFGKKKN